MLCTAVTIYVLVFVLLLLFLGFQRMWGCRRCFSADAAWGKVFHPCSLVVIYTCCSFMRAPDTKQNNTINATMVHSAFGAMILRPTTSLELCLVFSLIHLTTPPVPTRHSITLLHQRRHPVNAIELRTCASSQCAAHRDQLGSYCGPKEVVNDTAKKWENQRRARGDTAAAMWHCLQYTFRSRSECVREEECVCVISKRATAINRCPSLGCC